VSAHDLAGTGVRGPRFTLDQQRHTLVIATRILIVIVGILLPYAARLPRGTEWVGQYTGTGLNGFLMLEAFNAIAWGGLLGLTFLIRRPTAMLVPCLLGFGFLAWLHATLDLAADAQAGIGLVLIPIDALVPIAIGGVIGLVLDRRLDGKGVA